MKQKTMYGLENNDIMRIREVFAAHNEVAQAILYGSRAKGNDRPNSDIDLTLLGERLNLSLLLEIETELDDLLLPYTIDLSLYRHIENPALLAHIKRVGRVFYTRDNLALEKVFPNDDTHLLQAMMEREDLRG
jgi:predicted nucleotidyltransferase